MNIRLLQECKNWCLYLVTKLFYFGFNRLDNTKIEDSYNFNIKIDLKTIKKMKINLVEIIVFFLL